jgi:hypothetical protein
MLATRRVKCFGRTALRKERLVVAGVLVLCALVSTPSAAAEPSTGPDGTIITKDSYPTEFALRPIATPKGLVLVDLTPEWGLYCCTSDSSLSLTIEASYGVGSGFEVGADAVVLTKYGGEVFGRYQLLRNLGLYLWGGYSLDESQSQHHTDGAVGIGLPLKFKLPKVPVAIAALGNLFTIYRQTATVAISEPGLPPLLQSELPSSVQVQSTYTELVLPLTFEFSPLSFLSFEIGGRGVIKTSDTLPYAPAQSPQSTQTQPGLATQTIQIYSTWHGTLEVWGAVYATFRRFDIGVTAGHDFYFSTPTAENTYVSLTGEVRFW